MVITYHGNNYFKLQAGNLAILLNPINLRSVKGALAVISTIKPSAVPKTNETIWIDHQGEYEIKDLILKGWSNGGDDKYERTIYRLDLDEMKIAILTNIVKEPEEKVAKSLKASDIVIFSPEKRAASKETAIAGFLKNLEPGIIILGEENDSKAILKEFKKSSCEKIDKLVVKKKDINAKETRIICLNAQ
jgi:hypothetical protein